MAFDPGEECQDPDWILGQLDLDLQAEKTDPGTFAHAQYLGRSNGRLIGFIFQLEGADPTSRVLPILQRGHRSDHGEYPAGGVDPGCGSGWSYPAPPPAKGKPKYGLDISNSP